MRCLLTASGLYKRSTAAVAFSKKPKVISWPEGLADRIFEQIDKEALSQSQLELLAIDAGFNKRPEVIRWFKQNFTPDQLRHLLSANVLKRVEGVLLLTPSK